ncbi:hypothetical protein HID58_064753 [Brassica napus]|uniref:Uncharacterized protein n=1 Tax=Brassica napus TaxID=3708 RepID=A0ABQ7ZB45_BRANA|nr:hypothetical protein HID58_064753 [Brassica napus]
MSSVQPNVCLQTRKLLRSTRAFRYFQEAVKKGDAMFVGQYLFTGTETTSVWLEITNRPAVHLEMGKIMIREGDEAAAQEDERVGKEPEVERKRDAEPEFGKQKEKKEEKHKALKEKEMINSAAYKERERYRNMKR